MLFISIQFDGLWIFRDDEEQSRSHELCGLECWKSQKKEPSHMKIVKTSGNMFQQGSDSGHCKDDWCSGKQQPGRWDRCVFSMARGFDCSCFGSCYMMTCGIP